MEVEEKKKNIGINLVFIILIIILILFIVLVIHKWYMDAHPKKISIDSEDVVKYDDYVYKIKYEFGYEGYIYLLEDNAIKVVSVQEIYKEMPSCNCLMPTGEFDYKDETIDFSDDTKERVIKVFDELYEKYEKKEFDLEDADLTKDQLRIVLAVIMNDEDEITIEDDLSYQVVNNELSAQNSNYKIVNSKMVLDNKTGNKIVDKIADYLNVVISKDFDEVSSTSNSLINSINDNYGVNFKVEMVYAGPYSLSFVYTKEGRLGTDVIYDVKGYTFNYNGDVEEFSNGWKDEYQQSALDNFMKSDLYLEQSSKLTKDWEKVIYDNMFLTGNWYLSDGKVKFLIPAKLLGLNDVTVPVIELEAEVSEEF